MSPASFAIIPFVCLFLAVFETVKMDNATSTTLPIEEEYYPKTEIPKNYTKVIHIGFLMNQKGINSAKMGLTIPGALLMALEKVSSKTVELHVRWCDIILYWYGDFVYRAFWFPRVTGEE